MTVHRIAEIVSLLLTVPTIVMSVWVCWIWWSTAGTVFRGGPRNAKDWFILGVFIAFAGSVVDNAYWGLAWGSHFLDMASAESLFAKGVYFNIPARQLAGALGAFCHLRAAYQYNDDCNTTATAIALWSLLGGSLLALALVAYALCNGG